MTYPNLNSNMQLGALGNTINRKSKVFFSDDAINFVL